MGIPLFMKIHAIIFHLLPRTVICLRLSYVGTLFLIAADSYQDLILNSVALGFLIEIDEMLFAATMSSKYKRIIADLRPLEVPLTRIVAKACHEIHELIPQSCVFTVLLSAIVYTFIYTSYNMPGGKYEMGAALECLCHIEGEACVGAQILGGFAS